MWLRLTSAFGTNRTSWADLAMSVDWGRAEVVGARQSDAIDPLQTTLALSSFCALWMANIASLMGR